MTTKMARDCSPRHLKKCLGLQSQAVLGGYLSLSVKLFGLFVFATPPWKGQIGKIPGQIWEIPGQIGKVPKKSGKSQKDPKGIKKTKKGRTSPDREAPPPFEPPPPVTLPALQRIFVDFFFEFAWRFGIENSGDFW